MQQVTRTNKGHIKNNGKIIFFKSIIFLELNEFK